MSALTLAIPSKGRLKEQTEAFFGSIGCAIEPLGGARGYFARLSGFPDVEVRLLSASEIASGVLAGDLHVGVSGEDLLREQAGDLERLAHLLAPLDFGHADLVVAVPQSWLDVDTMADVDDVGARLETEARRKLRVATKYVRSTRRFFTAEGVGHYRIVESAGATEGAPAADTADIVVDITTTGATLASNGLKILSDGVILRSQANLVASLEAAWTPEGLGILKRLAAAIDAAHAERLGAGAVMARLARFQAASRTIGG
jgi:ATP phosphoribosyltransferase